MTVSLCVLFALIPAATATAGAQEREDAVVPVASELPVTELPDTAYTPPDVIPPLPEVEAPTRPPEGTPKAEALARLETEQAAQLATIDDQLTVDRVPGERPATEISEVSPTVEQNLREVAWSEPPLAPSAQQFHPEALGYGDGSQAAPASAQGLADPSSSHASERGSSGQPIVASAELAAEQNGCEQVPGVPYQGHLVFESMVTPLHNAQDGSYRVRLVNTGTTSWPAGTVITYELFNGLQPVPGTRPTTAVPIPAGGSVQGNGGWITFDATIGRLPPGTWLSAWNIFVPGAGWLTAHGNCSTNFELIVHNQAPTITYRGPASPGTVKTRTPQLTVSTGDVDSWPGNALTHIFKICRHPTGAPVCVTHNSGATPHWSPDVEWGVTYSWSVQVSDGDAITNGESQAQTFTVVIPEADDWRQVGNGLGLSDVFGVVLPYGVFLHRQTDAAVQGGSFPLAIERTYSSGAAQEEGAFGRGWLSLFDANAVWDEETSLLRATFPDGRQEAFGRTSTGWIARAELGSTTRVTEFSTQRTVIKQSSGEAVTYDTSTGRLLKVEMSDQESWNITYSNGLASRVTHQPSGRHIDVEWSTPAVTGCATSERATRPYVSALSVSRGPGETSRWTYAYECARLVTATDALGGIHRYTTTGNTFAATTPEGRQVRGLSSAGPWVSVSQKYQERIVRITEPGSAPRAIRLLRSLAGYENTYRSSYNNWNGLTALYCGHRTVSGSTESCPGANISLLFDTQGRLRSKAWREPGTGTSTGTFRTWLYSDVNGQLMGMIDENFSPVEYVYSSAGNLERSTVFRGGTEEITSINHYNIGGTGPRRLRGSVVTPRPLLSPVAMSEFVDQFTYDSAGRLVADDGPTVPGFPDGEQRSYTYTTGNETAIENGSAVSGERMPPGLLRTEVSAAGTTTHSYNKRGDLTRTVLPGGGTIAREYDARGHLAAEAVNGTARVEYTYDALGRATRDDHTCIPRSDLGVSTKLVVNRTYDRDGLPQSITEREINCSNGVQIEGSRTTTYTYTAQGRLQTVTDAAGGVTRYAYSSANPDLVETVTDPRGRVTTHTYHSRTGGVVNTRADIGLPGHTTRVDMAWYQYDYLGRKEMEVDALGRTTYYTVTNDGYVTRASRSGVVVGGTMRAVNLWERKYDGAGNLTRETLGESRVTEYTYDSLDRLHQSILDPGGLNRVLTVERDGAGRETGHVLGSGASATRTTYELNAAGYIIAERISLDAAIEDETAPAVTTKYVRDLWGNAVQIVDPRGVETPADATDYTTRTVADALGRVTETRSPSVTRETPAEVSGASAYTAPLVQTHTPTEKVVYNAFGEIVAATDADGSTTKYRYDSGGRMVGIRLPEYQDSAGNAVASVNRFTYSAAGDLIRKTDARGGITDLSYDIAGNLVREEGPVDSRGERPTVVYAYDAGSQLTSSWDANGVRTDFSYDALGRLVAETRTARVDPADESSPTAAFVTTYSYDVVGNQTSVTTPEGRTTRFEYNAAGEMTAQWLPERTTPHRWEYDFAGRVTKEIDSAGRGSLHWYDGAGREFATYRVSSDNQVHRTERTFDAAGNMISERNPRGVSRTFEVDALNRVTAVRQPTGLYQSYTVELGYDSVGNTVRVENGNGVNTWYEYNPWGLRTAVIEAPTERHPALADRQWLTRFDASGNAVELSKPGGVRVAAQYDALDRVSALTAGSGADAIETVYDYDLKNRLVGAESSNDEYVALMWDDLDRLVTSQTHGGGHRFAYDADGLLTLDESTSDGSLGAVVHTRDVEGRTTQSTNNSSRGSQTWTFGYDEATGDLATRSTPVGTTSWTYDTFGRTSTVKTVSSQNVTTQDVAYDYDSNGNVVEERINAGLDHGARYSYDWADRIQTSRLRDAQGGFGSPHSNVGLSTWVWDSAGNLTTWQRPLGFETRTYDERNRLAVQMVDDEVTSTATSYEVDARGNTTAIGGRELRFDALDQLVEDSGVDYAYDPLGRLQRRNNLTFDYAGLSIDPSAGIDGNGNREYAIRAASGALLGTAGRYFAGGNVDTRLSLSDRHTDTTSGIAVTGPAGASGSSVGATAYDPFGGREGGSASLVGYNSRASSFGFQSDWTDAVTKAVRMGARWYDPNSGTFLSRDDSSLPLASAGGINRYSYADGNPINRHDPTGLWTDVLPPDTLIDEMERQRISDRAITDQMERQFGKPLRPTLTRMPVERLAFGRAAAWVGMRFIPVLGWALLAVDAALVIGGMMNPQVAAPPAPPPPPRPSPKPPAAQAAAAPTGHITHSQRWVSAGARTTMANEGGYQVITQTFLSDLYLKTRIVYSNGSSEWAENYIGQYVVDSIRRVTSLVVDPRRVDQSHDVPGVIPAAQQVSLGAPASDDGACGLSGTLVSCATPARGIEANCAGWTGSASICLAMRAKPGPAGAVGPAMDSTSSDATPATATGSAGGGSRKPPSYPLGADDYDCDDLASSEQIERLRAKFEGVVRSQYWKHQARSNPGKWEPGQLQRMQRGRAPKGVDGKRMEVHHILPLYMGGDNSFENLMHMTRTDHRIGENFRMNHPC